MYQIGIEMSCLRSGNQKVGLCNSSLYQFRVFTLHYKGTSGQWSDSVEAYGRPPPPRAPRACGGEAVATARLQLQCQKNTQLPVLEFISEFQSESFVPDFFLKNSSFFLIFTFFFLSNNIGGAPSQRFPAPKTAQNNPETPLLSPHARSSHGRCDDPPIF